MKTLLITLVVMLMACIATAQLQYLVLENEEINEIHILEDDQMVRVVTKTGERHKGKMQIVDENTISIKGYHIALDDIDKIKKHSRLVAVILGVVVVYVSATALLAGVFIIAWSGEIAAGAAIGAIGAAGIYGAFNGINLNRSYKNYRGWTYRVETAQATAITP